MCRVTEGLEDTSQLLGNGHNGGEDDQDDSRTGIEAMGRSVDVVPGKYVEAERLTLRLPCGYPAVTLRLLLLARPAGACRGGSDDDIPHPESASRGSRPLTEART